MPYTNLPYIVETIDGDTTTGLFLDEAGLIAFLTENIRQAHYCGDGHAVKVIQYTPTDPGDGGGFLSELVLVGSGGTVDGDFIRCTYALHEHADVKAFGACDANKVLEFAVTIDGRA